MHVENTRPTPPLSNAREQIEHGLGLLGGARLAEDVPEPERLVAGARDDGLAVGGHGQVENPVRVARQLGHLHQRRVLPHEDLVLRVAVRAHQLVRVLRPGQVAHLRPRVHALQGLARQRVPEADAAVGRAPPAGQQPVLVGGPGDGLDRGQVLRVGLHGADGRHVPHEEAVVVAARRHVLVVGRPLEPAHLLAVAGEPPLGGEARRADVALQDEAVAAARRQDVPVPGQSADPGRVALQRVDLLVGRHVPDLDVPFVGAHGNQVAADPVGPGHGSHRVAVLREVAEPGDLAGAGAPQVDGRAEPDGEHVLRRPVDQVEVEVVLQLGSVQHLEGDLRDLAHRLPRRPQQLLALAAHRGEGVRRGITRIGISPRNSVSEKVSALF